MRIDMFVNHNVINNTYLNSYQTIANPFTNKLFVICSMNMYIYCLLFRDVAKAKVKYDAYMTQIKNTYVYYCLIHFSI